MILIHIQNYLIGRCEVSCIPIYRNQEWFNEAYYKLKDFWNTILEWRGKGLTKLENHIEEETKNEN